MGEIMEMLASINTDGLSSLIITAIIVCIIPFIIFYKLIKAAVRNGVAEALEKINLHRETRDGTREALREIDIKEIAKVFAEEFKKNKD